MKILAIIGNESHTTSRSWANLSINGKRVSYRDAISHEFKTEFGDKHAFWCECIFEVPEGAKLEWDAGSNRGNRGANRSREHLVLIADSAAPRFETNEVATLRGTMRLESNKNADAQAKHDELRDSI